MTAPAICMQRCAAQERPMHHRRHAFHEPGEEKKGKGYSSRREQVSEDGWGDSVWSERTTDAWSSSTCTVFWCGMLLVR